MTRRLYIERLRRRHIAVVRVSLALGWEVVAFDPGRDAKRRPAFRKLVVDGRLRLLQQQPLRGTEHPAIDAADRAGDLLVGDRTVRAIARLLATDEVTLVVKRVLAEQLSAVAFVHERLAAEAPAGSLLLVDRLLVARRLLRRLDVPWVDLPPTVRPLGTELTGRVREVAGAAARAGSAAGRLMAKLGTQLVPLRRPPERSRAPLGVAINNPFLLKFKGPRSYDFVIGGAVDAEDVLFLAEFPIDVAFVTGERPRGRRVLDVSQLSTLRALLTSDVRGPWWRASFGGLWTLVIGAWRHGFLADATIAASQGHLAWNVLLSHVDIDRYAFTNKEGRSQIVGNIVLRGAGVISSNYSLFIGGPYQLASPVSLFDDRNVLWAFLNSDEWILNNDAMRENFAAHPHQVRRHHVVGNIFGEMIAANAASGVAGLRGAFGLPEQPAGRTIAVFDTSFIDLPYAASSYDDAIAFFDDLLALLEDLAPDDRVLFKPSKAAWWYVDPSFVWSSPAKGALVVERQERLRDDARVVWLDDATDTTLVSAVADLTITHCFSSPTADALAGGRPAVWYESGERFVGYPFDGLPGLVVRGRDALRARVARVVPGGVEPPIVGDEVRRLVDPYLDGGALTRMRTILAPEEAGLVPQQCMSENVPPVKPRNTIGRP